MRLREEATTAKNEAGHEVVVCGPEAGVEYPSKHGYPARSDVAAKDVKVADYDALVVPGGYAPDHMRRVPAMVEAARLLPGAARRARGEGRGGGLIGPAGGPRKTGGRRAA